MNFSLKSFLVVLSMLLLACNLNTKQTPGQKWEPAEKEAGITDKTDLSKDKVLVEETLSAHGGAFYDNAHYGFTFRKKYYTFENTGGRYRYSVQSIKNKDTILDILENGNFRRSVNGTTTELTEKDIAKYSQALNSVIYFATLPHKLRDKAVHTSYEGETLIKGEKYDLIRVRFDEEGGGKDFDDIFLYWINSASKTIDYLAYSYSTNNGGVRFRVAFNQRSIDGIRFQDYINYEAPVGTPLEKLPSLYEKGQLRELSRIISENVQSLE